MRRGAGFRSHRGGDRPSRYAAVENAPAPTAEACRIARISSVHRMSMAQPSPSPAARISRTCCSACPAPISGSARGMARTCTTPPYRFNDEVIPSGRRSCAHRRGAPRSARGGLGQGDALRRSSDDTRADCSTASRCARRRETTQFGASNAITQRLCHGKRVAGSSAPAMMRVGRWNCRRIGRRSIPAMASHATAYPSRSMAVKSARDHARRRLARPRGRPGVNQRSRRGGQIA